MEGSIRTDERIVRLDEMIPVIVGKATTPRRTVNEEIARAIVGQMIEEITRAVAHNERVTIKCVGTFYRRPRAGRMRGLSNRGYRTICGFRASRWFRRKLELEVD